jgi:TolB-like protein
MRSFPTLLALGALILTLGGCSSSRLQSYKPTSYSSVAQSELIATNYQAADALITQAGMQLSPQHPIIVATLVNINALEESSALGRLVSEQLGARFAQQGYKVVELKIRQKLYMKRNEGELMLTREIRDIAQQHNAQALIIGTYTEGADRVFINLKLTQVETNIALAAVDYALPLDMNIRALLFRPEPL